MKSVTILGSLLSLGGIMISSTSALPTELTTRDAPKVSTKTCQVEVWQRSRKSTSKEDPYWLHVYVEDGTGKDRNVIAYALNRVPDSNTLKIHTPIAQIDSQGKFAAELSITTPALDDKKYKTEADRDAAPLSFELNQEKWTSGDQFLNAPLCFVSGYAVEPDDWLYNGVRPGEGPVGYPGKNYRQIVCPFVCNLADNTPTYPSLKEGLSKRTGEQLG
ncbi:MAG: hypothetical protein M1835_008172 [Candelina submexicana]|nr:MAG: hypothetical protein M1835_008172 [Candelina submexicana]